MVFALETFWPASDGWSAARIEEQLVVTATGCEVITRFPAENLMVAGRYHYHTVDGPLPGIRETAVAPQPPGRGLGGPAPPSRHAPLGWARTAASAAWQPDPRSAPAGAPPPAHRSGACGIRTVVSGGANRSANGMSLKPITDTSCGAAQPQLGQRRVGAQRQQVVAGHDRCRRRGSAPSSRACRRHPLGLGVGLGRRHHARVHLEPVLVHRLQEATPAQLAGRESPRARQVGDPGDGRAPTRCSTASVEPLRSSGTTAKAPLPSIVRLTSTTGRPAAIISVTTSSWRRGGRDHEAVHLAGHQHLDPLPLAVQARRRSTPPAWCSRPRPTPPPCPGSAAETAGL